MRICMQNPMSPEYSLCGDAVDLYDDLGIGEPFKFGESGDTINCEQCKKCIDEIKQIQRYKIP